MKTILSALGLSLLIFTSCGGQKKVEVDFIQDNIDNAVAQNTIQTDIIEKSGKILNPRTINADGSISYIPIDDWCSGFFPGSMWLTYNLTGDKKWLPLAEKYTEALDSVKYLKWHHDVGFMIGCSYLNGYRFADKKEYKDVMASSIPMGRLGKDSEIANLICYLLSDDASFITGAIIPIDGGFTAK